MRPSASDLIRKMRPRGESISVPELGERRAVGEAQAAVHALVHALDALAVQRERRGRRRARSSRGPCAIAQIPATKRPGFSMSRGSSCALSRCMIRAGRARRRPRPAPASFTASGAHSSMAWPPRGVRDRAPVGRAPPPTAVDRRRRPRARAGRRCRRRRARSTRCAQASAGAAAARPAPSPRPPGSAARRSSSPPAMSSNASRAASAPSRAPRSSRAAPCTARRVRRADRGAGQLGASASRTCSAMPSKPTRSAAPLAPRQTERRSASPSTQLERGGNEIRRPCSARAAPRRRPSGDRSARRRGGPSSGRGRSLNVASTMTPSVPNEPTKSFGKS